MNAIDRTPAKQFDSIICVSQTPWQGKFQNSAVQLLTVLSERYRILYVDYPYTVKDLVAGLRGKRQVPVKALTRVENPLTKLSLGPNRSVHVWTPPVLFPINWMSAAQHDTFLPLNTGRLIKGLRRVMQQLDMQKPLVINAFNPVLGLPLVGQLQEFATIYYCFDEISAEAWMGKHGTRYEQEFMKRVDAVITTSEALYRMKSQTQPHTFCVKNGANFDLFNQAYALRQQQSGNRAIVGYLGTADNRIDTQVVGYCARTMPEVEFQFVGLVVDPRVQEELSVYANVRFIPSLPPAELPPILAQWKAAMIPFVCNEHTYTIYPLKINEYLAAGLPVVSTPFSILDDFENAIAIAATPEAFQESLVQRMAEDTPEKQRQQVTLAQANSWERRAEEFEAVFDQVQAVKSPV